MVLETLAECLPEILLRWQLDGTSISRPLLLPMTCLAVHPKQKQNAEHRSNVRTPPSFAFEACEYLARGVPGRGGFAE